MLLGVVAIALLALGSIAAVAYLTAAPPAATPWQAAAADPAPEPDRGTTIPARAPMTTPAAALPVADAPIETPATAIATPPPPAATTAPVDPDRSSAILRPSVSRRCGQLSVRQVSGPGVAPDGAATLALELEVHDGEARVRNSSVRSPGTMRPALVACAQWAMRGVVLPAAAVEPGKSATVFVTVGMPDAAGR
jgi:hypothetical protein